MKTTPLVFVVCLIATGVVRSQVQLASEPGDSTPIVSSARILGAIPDGTPPSPSAPQLPARGTVREPPPQTSPWFGS
jgi:hypothetical protein